MEQDDSLSALAALPSQMGPQLHKLQCNRNTFIKMLLLAGVSGLPMACSREAEHKLEAPQLDTTKNFGDESVDTQRLATLEKRIQRVEDLEAIKHLKYEYGRICDDNYNPDAMVQLFTEDAVWDGGEAVGVHKGKEAIRKLFAEVSNLIEFAVHYFLHPVIQIDESGNFATAKWHLWQPCTKKNGPALWVSGIEYDKYRKVNGRWLISEIKLEVFFCTPYDQGWQQQQLIDITASS